MSACRPDELESPQKERKPKRRQDDDMNLTSRRSDRTASKKNRAMFVDRHEETFRFDSTTSSFDGECWIRQTTMPAQIVSHCWLVCMSNSCNRRKQSPCPLLLRVNGIKSFSPGRSIPLRITPTVDGTSSFPQRDTATDTLPIRLCQPQLQFRFVLTSA